MDEEILKISNIEKTNIYIFIYTYRFIKNIDSFSVKYFGYVGMILAIHFSNFILQIMQVSFIVKKNIT